MEENMERPNYYAIIPANVRYANISANAKLLYGEITALSNRTGTCWASNRYFSNLYGVATETVSRWVAELVTAGFVSTKINKSAGNKRYIRITEVPIDENVNTYRQKAQVNNIKTNIITIGDLETRKANLLSLVNAVTGRSFRTLPERGVKKTLDAFTLEEIDSALRGLAADPWHRTRMKEFKIDYLIRATTIDKFLDSSKSAVSVPTVKKKMEIDPIIEGSEFFPAEWPKGAGEFTEDEDENVYFRGVRVNGDNQGEMGRIREERYEVETKRQEKERGA